MGFFSYRVDAMPSLDTSVKPDRAPATRVSIFDGFPDPVEDLRPGTAWRRAYHSDLTLIRARASGAVYEDHPAPLSLKASLEGAETYVFGRREMTARPGVVLLTPSNGRHASRIAPNKQCQSLSVLFPSALARQALRLQQAGCEAALDEPDRLEAPFEFTPHHRPIDGELCALLSQLQTVNDPVAAEGLMMRALDYVLRSGAEANHATASLPAAKASVRRELFRRLSLARAAIHEDPAFDWTLEEMAKVAMMSPYHMHRAFTCAFGSTPGEYVRSKRIEVAAGLLAQTGLPIRTVAAKAGFENFSAFSRRFRLDMGATPSAYRSMAA